MLFPELNRAATLDSISQRRNSRSALRASSVLMSPVPHHRSASIFKLNECKHFHFFVVELGPIKVEFAGFKHVGDELSSNEGLLGWILYIDVESNKKRWRIQRSIRELIDFDYQLHRCVFDRKHSRLREVEDLIEDQRDSLNAADLYVQLSTYADRLSRLTGSVITCFPVLKFLELDSRGNHFVPAEYTPINTPAIAAAIVIRDYTAKTSDQLTIRIGDIVSVIEMNSPEQKSDNFWKAKLTISCASPHEPCFDNFLHQFEVGYLPSDCVKLFVGKCMIDEENRRGNERWERLKRSGLQAQRSLKKLLRTTNSFPRVFGVDLQKHLSETNQPIPAILVQCVETIERHGIVTGIYRQCGIQSNIRKLRSGFDSDNVPNLNDPAILHDIHCVSSLLKQYFRQLPNPLFTFELYSDLVSCFEKDSAQKVQQCRDIIHRLPPGHFSTAEYLMSHLSKMCSYTNFTDMTSRNLAIVWAPNLIRSPPMLLSSDSLLLHGLNVQTSLCNFLITNAKAIFMDDFSEISTPSTSEERTCLEVGNLNATAPPVLRSQTAPDLSNRDCVEINGGPSNLPPMFHTVLERPTRKISNHFLSWKRFMRGPSVDRSLFNLVGRKKNSSKVNEADDSEPIKWRRSNSTDAFKGVRNSESVISFVTRRADYLREKGWRSWFNRKLGKKSESSYDLPDDGEPHLVQIEMTPSCASPQLSSSVRSLQAACSSLRYNGNGTTCVDTDGFVAFSPVTNSAEIEPPSLALKPSSGSGEPSPLRRERRVVFQSDMSRSFEEVNQIIDHFKRDEKSDSEWPAPGDDDEDEDDRASSPSLCLDMSRYDNVSPSGSVSGRFPVFDTLKNGTSPFPESSRTSSRPSSKVQIYHL